MMSSSTTSKLHLGGLFLLVLTFTATAQVGFKCGSSSTKSRCQALVGYVSRNATTLSNITTLFGLKDLHSLLGANSLPLNTTANRAVAANQTIKIPITCSCINGTGTSDRGPIYKVKAGDGLDHIARNIFSLLVTYQQIAAANEIPDPDVIEIGQTLRIPLPCSCDAVEGAQVVHYGHVVAPESSVEMIAGEFGTTPETLLKLNGLANPKALKAESVLDVPLRACTSRVSNTSPDYPLLVSNGTYTFTANNCVQCKCDSSKNNGTLQCEPSPPEIKVHTWSQCPSMQCGGSHNLTLGKSSSSSSSSSSNSCDVTTCAYTGYTATAISTVLANESTCPVGTPQASSPPSDATKISLQQSKFLWLLNLALILCALLW
ncbi:Peptidoglycan-binding lysin domain [Macleaya cordata]|uniref:Peptidoglycan-binding lysin domain n=1 Tax=Macleaya cordata TaxID=56857 RepID=A0A200QNH9_MACCD|nr:Peptidoglycan-binding lysin domain [Macleaya cordata]